MATKNPANFRLQGFPRAPEKIRTPDTTVRSRMLYPAELLTHPLFFNSKNYYIYRLDKSQ